MRANSSEVAIPRRMRGLPLWNGYPVPFIVLRLDGEYHFAVNDSKTVVRCIRENRCAICGNRLESLMWWTGGSVAAMDSHGAYADTAMHYECMSYALQVCPYLAVRSFVTGKATDRAMSDLADHPKMAGLIDTTMIPGRPEVFMCVAARSFKLTAVLNEVPTRPYERVEYWRHGVKLDEAEGRVLAEKGYRERAPWVQQRAEEATKK